MKPGNPIFCTFRWQIRVERRYSHPQSLKKNILKKTPEKITPEERHWKMHRPRIPASLSFRGPSVGFPLNCPGIGGYRVYLERHLKPASFSTFRTYAVYGMKSYHVPGRYTCIHKQPGECDFFIVSGSLAMETRELIAIPAALRIVLPEAHPLMHQFY